MVRSSLYKSRIKQDLEFSTDYVRKLKDDKNREKVLPIGLIRANQNLLDDKLYMKAYSNMRVAAFISLLVGSYCFYVMVSANEFVGNISAGAAVIISLLNYTKYCFRLWQSRVGLTYPFGSYLDAVGMHPIEFLPLKISSRQLLKHHHQYKKLRKMKQKYTDFSK